MPRSPTYALAWSAEGETYSLYETGTGKVLHIGLNSPGWFAWLRRVSCFAFVGQNCRYIAHRESGVRGKSCWYARQLHQGRLRKFYLGRCTTLTQARLESVAAKLNSSDRQRETECQISGLPTASQRSDVVPVPPPSERVQILPALPPLVMTKFQAPRLRSRLVPRTRLIERLQQSVESPLTLLSAPAGYGKTTLLAQWLQESGLPVAWISLEPADNDPTRFLISLITALQLMIPQIGVLALAALQTLQPPTPEAVLTQLINELAEYGGGDIVLVLDDYHVIQHQAIQRGMTYFVEHLPLHMHLLLSTRTDPLLPLARLRARGQLMEIRTADFRFGSEETRAFLQEVMKLELPQQAIATLEQRTEGWIAGLQLAALSLQGQPDVSAFLAAFTGTHRFVLEYLGDEVLSQQPKAVQTFLLHTSILDRLSGPLCDAVMEREGGQTMLEELERANLFVVALDEERRWYRYHHLFAKMLRHHLQESEPALVPTLHRRASAWYQLHSFSTEMVQHALAIPDAELAAHLIEPIAFPLSQQGHISLVLQWLHALPEAQISSHPFLGLCYAFVLGFVNQVEASEERLKAVERHTERMSTRQAQTILGLTQNLRAYFARLSGDIGEAISRARQSLTLLPEVEEVVRACSTVTTLYAYQVSGNVTCAAEQEVAAAVARIRHSDNLLATEMGMCLSAQLHVLQGKLRRAAATYAQLLQAIPHLEAFHTTFSSLFYYFGLGDLLRECNDLQAAEQYLIQGMQLINEALPVEPWLAILGYSALARLQQACGQTTAALATLDAFICLARQRHFAPRQMAQEAAVRAQLELACGRQEAAIRWADESGLSLQNPDLSYPHECEYLALARVRIAQGREEPAGPLLKQVLHLLDLLQESAEANARLGSVLEILIVRVLALEAQRDWTGALTTLEQALVLAEPEGYVRLFIDEGAPMHALLRRAQTCSAVPAYVATLLAAFGEPPIAAHASPASCLDGQPEPLTEREREVLRLLLEGASNREIARRLVLSVNTVKRHVYNLCSKFGVHSRAQVMIRAGNFQDSDSVVEQRLTSRRNVFSRS